MRSRRNQDRRNENRIVWNLYGNQTQAQKIPVVFGETVEPDFADEQTET
jgi:hypothetical protein